MSLSWSAASSSTKRRACGEDTDDDGRVVKKRRTACANDDDDDDDKEKGAADDSDNLAAQQEIELLKMVDVRAHAVDWDRLVQLVRNAPVPVATLACLVALIVGPAPFIDRAGIAKNLQDRWMLIASHDSTYEASFVENEEASTTDLNSGPRSIPAPRNGQCVGCLRVVWRPAERVVSAARFRWLDSCLLPFSVTLTIRCCYSCYQDHILAIVSSHNTVVMWSDQAHLPALREFLNLHIRCHIVHPGLPDIILSFLC